MEENVSFDLMQSGLVNDETKTVAINCLQWGDTGKGKIVDLFSDWADIVARGTGGDNAGHTVWYGNDKYVSHLIPCGNPNKTNLMGSGMVINPKSLVDEIEMAKIHDINHQNLMLALNAALILPFHLVQDNLSEISAGKNKIGTTGRGIAWAYADRVNRSGLFVNHLLNKDSLAKKIKENYETKKFFFNSHDPQLIRALLDSMRLENSLYWDESNLFNLDAIIEKYYFYGQELKDLICDTDHFVRQSVGHKKIVIEGAQGLGLSNKYGTYPYVTSSDCSPYGSAEGIGLNYSQVDLSLGIIKAYVTRVGNGPFPTELGDDFSEDWCNNSSVDREKEFSILKGEVNFNQDNITDQDFMLGMRLRAIGDEYGATTGRPRRVGWLDLPLLRYAMNFGVKDLVVTKLDVLNGCDYIRVCNAYQYSGPQYIYGNRTLVRGTIFRETIMDYDVIKNCKPIYVDLPGWKSDIGGCKKISDLPENLTNYLGFIFKETGANIKILSTGFRKENIMFT
ncbi:MAG: adenylosuccinate synthetase [Patescibacteria group bacterium]